MKEDIQERQIIIGMLISDAFMNQIRPLVNSKHFKSITAKRIAMWCVEYFDKYNSTPKEDIADIFTDKAKTEQFDKGEEEDIADILESLSDEFKRDRFNVPYQISRTIRYFQSRALEQHNEEVKDLLDKGDVEGANALVAAYVPPSKTIINAFDLSDRRTLHNKLKQAFAESQEPLFKLPGAIGDMLNEFFIRDSFIALLAPEKRGKTFTLMELGIRASKAGCNVVFFQAGDMSESQQLRRIAINRARKSDKEKYVGEQYIPVKDCIKNQLDLCDARVRECDFGIFDASEVRERTDITKDMLIEKLQANPDYKPCHNCKNFQSSNWGSVWLKKVDLGDPLTLKEAIKTTDDFFVKHHRRFRLSTYANKTLSVKEMNNVLTEWEKEEFIADIVIVDYADILISDIKEYRQSQNDIWMELRGLSQKRHVCLITATQADAKSYKVDTLTLDNFSEDKRKWAHPTAGIGMNQDHKGREKELGIIRFNKIVAREGELDNTQVTVLQSLKQGQPLLTSFL